MPTGQWSSKLMKFSISRTTKTKSLPEGNTGHCKVSHPLQTRNCSTVFQSVRQSLLLHQPLKWTSHWRSGKEEGEREKTGLLLTGFIGLCEQPCSRQSNTCWMDASILAWKQTQSKDDIEHRKARRNIRPEMWSTKQRRQKRLSKESKAAPRLLSSNMLLSDQLSPEPFKLLSCLSWYFSLSMLHRSWISQNAKTSLMNKQDAGNKIKMAQM